MQNREKFGSRLGFILVSAGCAVGLGNVWKFPYMVGKYGGAVFIFIYLFFLIAMGLPIMVCEFAVGRGSQKSVATSYRELEPKNTRWHRFGYLGMVGNYVLMMFYTMVGGWMLCYCYKSLTGEFAGAGITTKQVAGIFEQVLASPGKMIFWMMLAVVLSFGICSLGVQKGIERITKIMMCALLALIVILCIKVVTLQGAAEGIEFYLVPDFNKVKELGIWNIIFAAMSQAFFTLSIGIGSMAIFGSYLNKDRSLTGEALSITILDTFVALMAGMIVIPACFAFGVEPDSGPSLIFITLPNIFHQMAGGRIWGSLFFLFLSFAALSTIIAVFENIISFAIDLWGWKRRKAVLFNMVLIIILSIPCILGFNLWAGIAPLGPGTGIMDLEDFLVSSNLLPLGALVYLLFCTGKKGWGWDNFIKEANAGKGIRFPVWLKGYMRYVLPLAIILVYIKGYWDLFEPRGMGVFLPWMCIAALFLGVGGWMIYAKKKR